MHFDPKKYTSLQRIMLKTHSSIEIQAAILNFLNKNFSPKFQSLHPTDISFNECDGLENAKKHLLLEKSRFGGFPLDYEGKEKIRERWAT